MRWKLLRRGSRVRGRAKRQLCGLLQSQAGHRPGLDAQGNLRTLLELPIADLGQRLSGLSGRTRALRSRIEPMKKVARMLRIA